MGGSGSRLEKALVHEFPSGERFFGLQNFGNTCYCNSVLQALYFCVPFREKLLDYYSKEKANDEGEENLLTCLADLFTQINSQKKKTGVIAPKRFVNRLKTQNELFRSHMHQDAHEFLNFLLNELVDILEKEAGASKAAPGQAERLSNGLINGLANGSLHQSNFTWVHKIFQLAGGTETDEDQVSTSNSGDSPEKVHVHGAAWEIHEAFVSSRLPYGIKNFQHSR